MVRGSGSSKRAPTSNVSALSLATQSHNTATINSNTADFAQGKPEKFCQTSTTSKMTNRPSPQRLRSNSSRELLSPSPQAKTATQLVSIIGSGSRYETEDDIRETAKINSGSGPAAVTDNYVNTNQHMHSTSLHNTRPVTPKVPSLQSLQHVQQVQGHTPHPVSLNSKRQPQLVLSSKPFLDSLSLFVLLIQFPNLVIYFVHIIFACFTFVTPTTPSSGSLLANFTHATPVSPSLLTVFFADVMVAIVSIFFVPWLRTIMVDIGSGVIASSLAGGGSRIAFYCTGFLQISRLAQHSLYLFRRGFFPIQQSQQSYVNLTTSNKSLIPNTWEFIYGSAGWFSQGVAVHIVAQCIMHSIRQVFLEKDKLSTMGPVAPASGGLREFADIDYDVNILGTAPCSDYFAQTGPIIRHHSSNATLSDSASLIGKNFEDTTGGESTGANHTSIGDGLNPFSVVNQVQNGAAVWNHSSSNVSNSHWQTHGSITSSKKKKKSSGLSATPTAIALNPYSYPTGTSNSHGANNKYNKQPLWSALANTLVLASRETHSYQTSPGFVDVADNFKKRDDSHRSILSSFVSDDSFMKPNIQAGSSSCDAPVDLCGCVRYILENEVAFEIIPISLALSTSSTEGRSRFRGERSNSSDSTATAKFTTSNLSATEDFYAEISVRVNGILWPEVSIQTIVPKSQLTGDLPSFMRDIGHLESQTASSSTLLPLTTYSTNSLALTEASLANDDTAEMLLVVSGLTPITEYELEICKNVQGKVFAICKTNICTSPKESTSSTLLSALSAQSHVSGSGIQTNLSPCLSSASLTNTLPNIPSRPLSPVTTLLDTLCTTNVILTEEKQKLKKSRREHSKRLAGIRQDIDALKSKLGSGDKGEERAWRRVLALREAVRRTDDEITILNSELNESEVETIDDNELNIQRTEWETALGMLKDAERQHEREKHDAIQSMKIATTEGAVLHSKRDKLIARRKKLLSDFDRADSERQEAWNLEFERRRFERLKLTERRRAIEDEFSNAITKMERGIVDIEERTAACWQGLGVLLDDSAPA
ncbi:uncharacterized protein V1510DRAFT_409403 [Dipodascopsis tothii]|uniref:uncharacterized protein n=1 Tax=Dipodascopsis tothii TaxID=44089 RepID=UPI0034CEBB85